MVKRKSAKAKSDGKLTPYRFAKQQALLHRAVDDWPQFDGEESVNGGDLVEWFAVFRADIKRALGSAR